MLCVYPLQNVYTFQNAGQYPQISEFDTWDIVYMLLFPGSSSQLFDQQLDNLDIEFSLLRSSLAFSSIYIEIIPVIGSQQNGHIPQGVR